MLIDDDWCWLVLIGVDWCWLNHWCDTRVTLERTLDMLRTHVPWTASNGRANVIFNQTGVTWTPLGPLQLHQSWKRISGVFQPNFVFVCDYSHNMLLCWLLFTHFKSDFHSCVQSQLFKCSQHSRLSICSNVGWVWQILRRAGLSIEMVLMIQNDCVLIFSV